MRYQIYMYGTTVISSTADGLGIINRVLKTNSEKDWKSWSADKLLKDFDVKAIKERIQQEFGTSCQVDVKFPPKDFQQTAYLSIVTSYEKVRKILPYVHAIAAEEGLALYDEERDESFYKDLVDDAFVSWKMREEVIRERILAENVPVSQYKKLSDGENESSFVVTLRKNPEVSFEKRVQQFFDTLEHARIDGEELVCEHGCFIISNELYSITICLEGYGDHPDRMGYYMDGYPGVHILNRMGCYEAFMWLKRCTDLEKNDTFARMNFLEMKDKYKNPAMRFVQSVEITKQLQKEVFDIRYSGWGYYSSEILFHIVPEEELNNAAGISTLKIEEESATFILPFIKEIYSYIDQRYYVIENHLPMEMWNKIIDRILEAKEMILHDTFNPELKSYIEQFNLYVLSKDDRAEDYYECGEGYRIKHEPEKFLYEHRFEVAHLYDIFVEWSKTQIIHYSGWTNEMFNIQGP